MHWNKSLIPLAFTAGALAFCGASASAAQSAAPEQAQAQDDGCGDGIAIEKNNAHWTFSAQWENDIFARTDCDYTNGAKLSWTSPDLTEYRDAGTVPGIIYRVSDYLPFIHAKSTQRNVSINIGQNMYTPADISTPDPDPMDRPYAGWLYIGFGFHNKTERWLDIIELNIGMVGPMSFAEETQKFIHRNLRGNIIPQGWDHQIGNEPSINLVGERKLRFWRMGDASGPAADAFVHLGGSLGTLYTFLNGGFTMRTGWNLPTDFGSSPIRIAGDVNDPAAADDPRLEGGTGWGLHVFLDLDQRAILRDGTLDGNLFSDSISVDKIPFVTDVSIGASLILGSWKISYAQVARSKEFHTQTDKWHVFGSMSISYTY
ncbi:MAG: lipid A deacylase LpxR family protein [Opitutales bacterium]|jgi:hypothetical protein